MTAAQQKKIEAWLQQHGALEAPQYRITCMSRRAGLPTFNHGKGRAKGGGERFYDAGEVEELIPYLSSQNAKGYDIYITPIDPDHHYLVVDDMRASAVEPLQAAGYSPALVQQSSDDNYQAVLKAPTNRDEPEPDERSSANQAVEDLNQAYGDPGFSGVAHPFRMAGFANKKQGKGSPFTRIVEALGGVCRRTAELVEQYRAKAREARAAKQASKERQRRSELVGELAERRQPMPDTAGPAGPVFARERQYVEQWVGDHGWEQDESRVDWQAAAVLLRAGYSETDVHHAIRDASPGIDERHYAPDDYATRTVQGVAGMLEAGEDSSYWEPHQSYIEYRPRLGAPSLADIGPRAERQRSEQGSKPDLGL